MKSRYSMCPNCRIHLIEGKWQRNVYRRAHSSLWRKRSGASSPRDDSGSSVDGELGGLSLSKTLHRSLIDVFWLPRRHQNRVQAYQSQEVHRAEQSFAMVLAAVQEWLVAFFSWLLAFRPQRILDALLDSNESRSKCKTPILPGLQESIGRVARLYL